jgi:hypothetical protein
MSPWRRAHSTLKGIWGIQKGKKVKLSLCFFFYWAPRHEGVLGGAEVYLHAFLTLALDGGELSAPLPGSFTLRQRVPGTPWLGGWVGPRAVLDAMVKRKIPSPRRELNPRTLIVQPVAQRQVVKYLNEQRWWTMTSFCDDRVGSAGSVQGTPSSVDKLPHAWGRTWIKELINSLLLSFATGFQEAKKKTSVWGAWNTLLL